MKKYILLFFLVYISYSAFAGPFGFNSGMTLEEIATACGGIEPESIGDDRYLVSPIKSHPDFENYIVWVSKTNGLYYIKAVSKKIQTNGYGTDIKSKFYDIEFSLSRIYGKPTVTDKLDPKSIFSGEDYWMFTLSQGARELYDTWGLNKDKAMPDSINFIILYVAAENSQNGYIMLEYEFEIATKVKEEKDSVF